MRKKYQVLLLLIMICQVTFSQKENNLKKQIGLAGFLKQFDDISTLPAYESATYSAETSTYDRTGGNNDGFAGTYSFIRRNADSTLVLFDQKGPGVINRFWTPTPTDDTLDFYIDDTLKVTFSILYRDLYTGKVYPFVAPLCANQLGGYYCYLPVPFNKSCKIVLRAKTTRFHQIGYKLFSPQILLKSFSLPLDVDEKKAIQKIKTVWSKPGVNIKDLYDNDVSLNEIKKISTIKPGQTVTLFQSVTPGRIAGFELISSAPLDSIAKNIDLKITWDDEKTAAVYCPMADYFGYAFGKASMQGLLAGCDGKKHYSWFPMPYDKSAKIELIYRIGLQHNEMSSVTLQSTFYTQNKKRGEKTEGKFYALWNRENPVATGKAYTMLDVKGKGHFTGVALQAQGLRTGITIFFEGDDSTAVDGDPRMHGTGSEDFFNGGWYALLDCWDDAMSLPLSGALDYSIPLCRTGGYRFFVPDKISFEKSFFQSIEHGPEFNQVPADYTSVSYYYCDRPNGQKIIPSNSNTKLYMPDTLEIYPQLMLTAMDESVAAEAKWDGTPAKTMFYTIDNKSLLKMSLQNIPTGNYDVYFDYRKRNDAAQFSIWQRQTQLSEWMDAYATESEKLSMQKIGSITLTKLNNAMSFHFKTTEQRNKFILTRIVLIRK